MRKLRPKTTQQEVARLGFKTKLGLTPLRDHTASQMTQLDVEAGANKWYREGQEDADAMEGEPRQAS